MKREVYKTGAPLNHTYEIYYDGNDEKVMFKAKKEYHGYVDWRATTHYADFGKRRLKSSTSFSTSNGSYTIKFDYYDDGSIKTANLNTDYGKIDLQYSPDGKLETLKKNVDGKKTTYNYTYAKGKEPDKHSVLSAEALEDKYSSWYIDSTGGFYAFDYISDPENFAKMKKQGITVTTNATPKRRFL